MIDFDYLEEFNEKLFVDQNVHSFKTRQSSRQSAAAAAAIAKLFQSKKKVAGMQESIHNLRFQHNNQQVAAAGEIGDKEFKM
ncbi:hypothetical protein DERP_004591 [Dermatophagoides pteronyssinus]|uniref:Uncharacterized protein n=1 Tax=Dermatophagoides pteronyssinus TaxID=6956 RepID=A0ABQ8JPQ3_DERPT|nr:hypothetical protein DERP_004591 [Dermatophagoides pteronyssinus]